MSIHGCQKKENEIWCGVYVYVYVCVCVCAHSTTIHIDACAQSLWGDTHSWLQVIENWWFLFVAVVMCVLSSVGSLHLLFGQDNIYTPRWCQNTKYVNFRSLCFILHLIIDLILSNFFTKMKETRWKIRYAIERKIKKSIATINFWCVPRWMWFLYSCLLLKATKSKLHNDMCEMGVFYCCEWEVHNHKKKIVAPQNVCWTMLEQTTTYM